MDRTHRHKDFCYIFSVKSHTRLDPMAQDPGWPTWTQTPGLPSSRLVQLQTGSHGPRVPASPWNPTLQIYLNKPRVQNCYSTFQYQTGPMDPSSRTTAIDPSSRTDFVDPGPKTQAYYYIMDPGPSPTAASRWLLWIQDSGLSLWIPPPGLLLRTQTKGPPQ